MCYMPCGVWWRRNIGCTSLQTSIPFWVHKPMAAIKQGIATSATTLPTEFPWHIPLSKDVLDEHYICSQIDIIL